MVSAHQVNTGAKNFPAAALFDAAQAIVREISIPPRYRDLAPSWAGDGALRCALALERRPRWNGKVLSLLGRCVRRAVVDGLRREGAAPRHVVEWSRDLEACVEGARQAGAPEPTDAEVARRWGVSLPTAAKRCQQIRGGRACTWSALATEDRRPADPASVDLGPVRVADAEAVRLALLALPERSRAVVVLCWLRGESRARVARRIGVTASRVYQILAEARGLMRARLEEAGHGQ